MKTLALTREELYSISTYQEYLDATKELTVLVEFVNGIFHILGIFKDHISTVCHNKLHYYDLISKLPVKVLNSTLLHTLQDKALSVHIYQKSTTGKKWRGINLSAYDNGVLNAQQGDKPSAGLCTDNEKDTGGWFYTADQTEGAPSRVGNTTTIWPSKTYAYTGSPLHEVENTDLRYATSYPLPSQIMAAINAGVNIFRVPFMPQFMPQIATGWAKEGFASGDMTDVYKPGNCLYFSFYMSTVNFILTYAKSGLKPDKKTQNPGWHNAKEVKVIIDCHSYMRWAPMNILATSTALDGPPNRKYSMDRNTDLRCPYTLVSDSSNNDYISTTTDIQTIQNILGEPAGWISKIGNPNPIKWADISGNPPEDGDITKPNISAHICRGATNQSTGYSTDDTKWDMIDKSRTFCQSNDPAKNQCYGGPTKTVLGINCLPMLWYKLLQTKFHLCDSETCIPVSPTPAPAPTPVPAPSPPGCLKVGDTGCDTTSCCPGLNCKSEHEWVCRSPTPPTPAPPREGTNMCIQISKDIEDDNQNQTLLEFITENKDNIWLDLMNEPNQVNTRDLGTAYGKVLKVLQHYGVTNKLLIEGNYWTGMHAQIVPGASAAQGWTWESDTPPNYNNISGSLRSYRGSGLEPSFVEGSKKVYLTDIKNSPAEILYQSMSAEYNTGPNHSQRGSFKEVDWALNLHQYMDVNCTGGHGCYSAEQLNIQDVSAMKVFTRFDAIEAWSHARNISLIVTEFGAQLYTRDKYAHDKDFWVKQSVFVKEESDSKVYSAGCEQKTNLFLQMMEQSDQVMGWTMWRATPPVSYAQFNTQASMIGQSTDNTKPANYSSPVYGWSNGIVWDTDEIDKPKSNYNFLQNSAQFSKPFTKRMISSDDKSVNTMPFIATGNLWHLSGAPADNKFWDDISNQNYPSIDPDQPLPNFKEHATYTHKNVGYKQ